MDIRQQPLERGGEVPVVTTIVEKRIQRAALDAGQASVIADQVQQYVRQPRQPGAMRDGTQDEHDERLLFVVAARIGQDFANRLLGVGRHERSRGRDPPAGVERRRPRQLLQLPALPFERFQERDLLAGRESAHVAVDSDADGVPFDELSPGRFGLRRDPGGQPSERRHRTPVVTRHQGKDAPRRNATPDLSTVPSLTLDEPRQVPPGKELRYVTMHRLESARGHRPEQLRGNRPSARLLVLAPAPAQVRIVGVFTTLRNCATRGARNEEHRAQTPGCIQ